MNRQQRRAVDRVKRKAKPVKTPGADTRIQQLESTVDALRRAFNKNHSAYASAISALDGHFAILRAVLNDVHRKEVQVGVDGDIDWEAYYAMYNQYIADQKKANKEQEGAVPEEQVFGGDCGSGD